MTGKNPFVMLVNEQTTVLHALYHETLAQLLTSSHSLDLKREKIPWYKQTLFFHLYPEYSQATED
jgi:hypothetical protein